MRTSIPVTAEWLFKKSRISWVSTEFELSENGVFSFSNEHNKGWSLGEKVLEVSETWWSAQGYGHYEGSIYTAEMPLEKNQGSSESGRVMFVGSFQPADSENVYPLLMIVD